MKRTAQFIVSIMAAFCLFITGSRADGNHAEGIKLDGTVGTAGDLELSGPEYEIKSEYGQQAGTNLFHSFERFNVHSDESAFFSGPASIENVVSRVTGGDASWIDGMLRSDMGADLYFLNPAGVMFGPNASLRLEGSFHVSTGDYLRLGDDRFYSMPSANDVLSVEAPAAFGFLDGAVAPISLEGQGEIARVGQLQGDQPAGNEPDDPADSVTDQPPDDVEGEDIGEPGVNVDMAIGDAGLAMHEGQTLTLVGGNIEIKNGAFYKDVSVNTEGREIVSIERIGNVFIPEGNVAMAAVASEGEFIFGDDSPDASSFDKLANINMTGNALIQLSGKRSGNVFIRCDLMSAENSAIMCNTYGDQDGGMIDIEAGSISFSNGSSINSITDSTGDGGSISIKTSGQLCFSGSGNLSGEASGIFLDTFFEGQDGGKAGELYIEAESILFENSASIRSSTFGGGRGGSVTLKADGSVTFSGGQGMGSSGVYIETYSPIDTNDETGDLGKGGRLAIEADGIYLTEGALLNSTAYGKGEAGTVSLKARDIRFEGGTLQGVTDVESTGGSAGPVWIETTDLSLLDGGSILGFTHGPGNGGNIEIIAGGTVTVEGVNDSGRGSAIEAGANPKEVPGQESVAGQSGNIYLEAENLILKDGGRISSGSNATFGQAGDGGNIAIEVAGSVEISGVNIYGENDDGFGSGIYARSFGQADKAGNAGRIGLNAGSLSIFDGGVVQSSSTTRGNSGDIDIHVGNGVTVSGDSSGIRLKEPANSQTEYLEIYDPPLYNQSVSGIYVDTLNTEPESGEGGRLLIEAGTVLFEKGASIRSSTYGAQNGGDVSLEAESITFAGNSGTEGDAWSTSGVYIETHNREEYAGDGGTLLIKADGIYWERGAIISSTTYGCGDAGTVTLSGRDIRFTDSSGGAGSSIQGLVDADSTGGNGGKVAVNATDLLIADGSGILGITNGPGNGGSIIINATGTVTLEGVNNKGRSSSIDTSSTPSTVSGEDGQTAVYPDGSYIPAGGPGGLINSPRGSGGATDQPSGPGEPTAPPGDSDGPTDQPGGSGEPTAPSGDSGGPADQPSDSGGPTAPQGDSGPNPRSDSNEDKTTLIAGSGGMIDLTAGKLVITDGGRIAASSNATYGQSGDGGDITINTGSIQISGVNPRGENNDGFGSGIYARSFGQAALAGRGGSVKIETGELTIENGGVIQSDTTTCGRGGDVEIRVDGRAVLSGDSFQIPLEEPAQSQQEYLEIYNPVFHSGSVSGIYLDTLNAEAEAGTGGTLLFEAETILFENGAAIRSSTYGGGTGGAVTLKAEKSVRFAGEGGWGTFSGVYLETVGLEDSAGPGGHLYIEADSIDIMGGAGISSATFGRAKAGTVELKGRDIRFTGTGAQGDGSSILGLVGAGSNGGVGGKIAIETTDLLLADGAGVLGFVNGPGDGGEIDITATGTVTLEGVGGKGQSSAIDSSSNPLPGSDGGLAPVGGDGGKIVVEAENLVLRDGGRIAAGSNAGYGSSGTGGSVTVKADSVSISGVNPHGENENGFGSGIYARSTGLPGQAGNGGVIEMEAGTLTIENGGVVASDTSTGGESGDVHIRVEDSVTITGDSSLIQLDEPSETQSEFLQLYNPSEYNRSVSGIYARSTYDGENAGQAGEITLSAGGDIRLSGGSEISTGALLSGGGKINVHTEAYLYLLDARISTSVAQGADNGGDVIIGNAETGKGPVFTVLNRSDIRANAYAGDGGAIFITTDNFVKSGNSVVSATSRRGNDGTVEIAAPDLNLAAGIAILPGSYLDAADWMETPCAARTGEDVSRFVIKGRDAVATPFDDWKKSPNTGDRGDSQ